jgi:y4mF family transcriptional regulator
MNSINSAQTLGTTIKAARKRLGLTQSELALAAGVGLRFMVELEGGKSTVRLEQVLRVIDALGGPWPSVALIPLRRLTMAHEIGVGLIS